ncbi:MAG: tripartite tricarboxylate transporter TctB family protein [Pseudomonadota bacterium]
MSEPRKAPPKPGAVVFAAAFLVLAVVLLAQIGEQAKFSAKTLGTGKMFAQPAFWPAVSLAGMVVFGLLHLISAYRARIAGRRDELLSWLGPLEYLIWFMVYVFAVPMVGYLPATLVFTTALALRAGYRSTRMLGIAALTGIGIVLIFKTALSVKIPGGALYEFLPDGLRSCAIVYF